MSEHSIILLASIYLLGAWLGRKISKNLYYYHVNDWKKSLVIFMASILSWLSVMFFLVAFYVATKENRD